MSVGNHGWNVLQCRPIDRKQVQNSKRVFTANIPVFGSQNFGQELWPRRAWWTGEKISTWEFIRQRPTNSCHTYRQQEFSEIRISSTLRIMGSQNWWFPDPRPLLYTSKPLYSRIQWFWGQFVFPLTVGVTWDSPMFGINRYNSHAHKEAVSASFRLGVAGGFTDFFGHLKILL